MPPPPAQCGYAADFALVQGMDPRQQVTAPKPAKGAYFRDPSYGTCVVRGTDHANEASNTFLRNDYSRRQAFNANTSKFLVADMNGDWFLYDAATLARIKILTGLDGDCEPQWHPTDPDLLYYLPANGGALSLRRRNVTTDADVEAGSFAGRLPWGTAAHVWSKSEGSPSADGRYWCFMVDNGAWGSLGFFTWDLQTNTILGTYSTNGDRPDHLSTSASGNYCVVSWDANTGPTGPQGRGGVWVFNRDFTNPRQIHYTGEHSDVALLPNGDDAFVSIDYNAGDGAVWFTNLRTGVRTDLFATYLSGTATAIHFSGKGYGKPGWAVVSTYEVPPPESPVQWLHRKIFIAELAANPRIYMVAHHHVNPYSGAYWDEPHASVSRDFTRIAFNSNWNAGNTNVNQYLIALPAGVLPQLP